MDNIKELEIKEIESDVDKILRAKGLEKKLCIYDYNLLKINLTQLTINNILKVIKQLQKTLGDKK